MMAALAAWAVVPLPQTEAEEPRTPAALDSRPKTMDDVDGSLMICGGGHLPDVIKERFVELAGGKEAKIVVIPTATRCSIADEPAREAYLEPWRQYEPGSVSLLHTESRAAADKAEFVEPLREATGVWIGGGSQMRLAEIYLGTRVEQELYALLKRGGVVGGTSAGAAIQSRVMIAQGFPKPQIATGFDLLPGAVIDQHFLKRKRLPRLTEAVAQNPGLIGFGTDEGTAMVVRDGQLKVLGESTVTVVLPSAADNQPPEKFELQPNTSVDLSELRQTARERAQDSEEASVTVEIETLSR